MASVLGRSGTFPERGNHALAFALPCLIAFALFWPVQGIAIEMDMIVALFPSLHGRYPASQLIWASPTPCRAAPAIMYSRGALVASASTRQGLPGSSADHSTRAVPNHPGRSEPLHTPVASRSVLSGFIQVGRTGHLRFPIEAESGSLALRLACSPHKSASPITGTRAHSATC